MEFSVEIVEGSGAALPFDYFHGDSQRIICLTIDERPVYV